MSCENVKHWRCKNKIHEHTNNEQRQTKCFYSYNIHHFEECLKSRLNFKWIKWFQKRMCHKWILNGSKIWLRLYSEKKQQNSLNSFNITFYGVSRTSRTQNARTHPKSDQFKWTHDSADDRTIKHNEKIYADKYRLFFFFNCLVTKNWDERKILYWKICHLNGTILRT